MLQAWIARHQDSLAGAAFPADQDRRVARGDFAGKVDRPLHGRVGAVEHRLAAGEAHHFFKTGEPAFQRPQPGHPLDDQLHLAWREGLGQVIRRAPFHGFDGCVDGAVPGDDDDPHPWALGQKIGKQVQALVGAEAQIDEGQVEDLCADSERASRALLTPVTVCPSSSRLIASVLRMLISSSTMRIFSG